MSLATMKLPLLIVLLQVFTQVPATVSAEDRCRVPNNSTLDECLIRFVNKWEEIRKAKPEVDEVVFPILAMGSDDLNGLCILIDEAKRVCGEAIETCGNHEITKFIQRNFVYGCRNQLFHDQSQCLLSAIAGHRQCLTILHKSGDDTNPCPKAEQFFKCIHDEAYRLCNAKGVAGLVHAIDSYGCGVKNLNTRLDGQLNSVPTCSTDEQQEVVKCFQPLLNLWSEIRDNDTSLLETAFPLFKFQRSDLVKMCEQVRVIKDRCFVQIQRCPGHPLPEFVNAVLGSACGTQQSSFLISYDCIKATIADNDQCRPYTAGAWQPGHLKEICGRMPQYYKCLEKPLTTRCFSEGAGVLAQAIKQYGCELHIDVPATASVTSSSLSESTTTIASAVSIPSAVDFLDFAGPPSNGPQAPSPAIGPPSSNPQPFLEGSPLLLQQPSFIGAPPTQPWLLSGPPETVFNQINTGDSLRSFPPPADFSKPIPPPSDALKPASTPLGSPKPISSPADPLKPVSLAVDIQPAPPASFLLESQQQTSASPFNPPIPPAPGSFLASIDSVPAQSAVSIAAPTASSSAVDPTSIVTASTTAQAASLSTATGFTASSSPSASPATGSNAQPLPTVSSSSSTILPPSLASAAASIQATNSQSVASSGITSSASPASTGITSSPGRVSDTTRPPNHECSLERRNQLRECLNPLYRKWVETHGRMMSANQGVNLTFPIYHYVKNEVVELCDHYASAIIRCPFSFFLECLSDDAVYLANAIFGYMCAPQNVVNFYRYFDCTATVVKQRSDCWKGVQGALLTVHPDSSKRCDGAKQFYSCTRAQIDHDCGSDAEKVFAEAIKQYGCEMNR